MIIEEFAINPDLVSVELRDLTLLTTNFGFHNGAVISQFPGAWVRKLKERARIEVTEVLRLKRINLKIDILKNDCLIKSGRDYDSESSWIKNATKQQKEHSFYRIVDEDGSSGCTEVIRFDDIDEKLFAELRGGKYPRDAKTMAAQARLLLINSKNIKIIDPYFDPSKEGYIKTINEMLLAADCSGRNNIASFEVHSSIKRGVGEIDVDSSVDEVKSQFKNIVPSGKRLSFFWWDDNDTREIHPRYLITEKGGIRYDRGFQEPTDHDQRRSCADISVMSKRECEDTYFQYIEQRSQFKLIKRVDIVG